MRSFLYLLLATSAFGQASIPAVSIYQAAGGIGIVYIQPNSGSQIINQRASLNWKTLGVQLATNASIGTVIAKATSEIHMNNAWTLGLSGFFALGEYTLGKLQTTAPQGTASLGTILQLNTNVTPGSEYTMFASSFGQTVGSALPKKLKLAKSGAAMPPLFGSVTIQGIQVTFTAQPIQTTILAAGARISGLIVVDVLVGSSPAAPAVTGGIQYPGRWQDFSPLDTSYYDPVILAKIQKAHDIASAWEQK